MRRHCALGLLDVCLRLETGAERAAYMASPIGRIRRACRKYRLKEGEDAILTLRRVKVSLKNCTLITALLDPQLRETRYRTPSHLS